MTSYATPKSSKWKSFLSVVAAALGAVCVFSIPASQTWSGDATVYQVWTARLAKEGLAVYPALGRDFLQHYLGFPAPTRFGWLLLVAALRRWFSLGQDPYRAQILIAWTAGVLIGPVLMLWLRHAVPLRALLFTGALVIAAPLLHGMSQYAYPDTLHGLLAISLFSTVSAWSMAQRRWLLPLMAFFSLAVISTREIGIYVVAALGLLASEQWLRQPPQTRSPRDLFRWAAAPAFSLPLAAIMLGCVAAMLIGMLLLGGMTPYFDVVRGYVSGTLNEPTYAPQVMNGPYYRYVVDLMLVSPAAVLLAMLALIPLLHDAEYAPLVRRLLPVLLLTLSLYSFFAKSLRYVIVVDCLLRVIAACAVMLVARKSTFAAVLLVLVLLGHDVYTYEKMWADRQVYDPVTTELVRALKMIRR